MSSKPSKGSFGKDEIDSAKKDLDKFTKDVSELGMKHKQFWEETRHMTLVNNSTNNNSKFLNKFVLLQSGIGGSPDSAKVSWLPIPGGTLGYINNANIFRVIQNPEAEMKERGGTSTKLIDFLEEKNMVVTIPNELQIKEFQWLSGNKVHPVFSGSPPKDSSMPGPGPLFFIINEPISYDKAKQYLMYNGVMPGEYDNDIVRVNQLNKNVFLDGSDGAASNIFVTKPTIVPDSMVLFEKDTLMPSNVCGSTDSMGIDGSTSWEQADGSEYKELEVLNNWDFDSCKSFAESRGSKEFALGAGEDWKLVVVHNPSSQQQLHGTNLSGEYRCGSKTMKPQLMVRANIGNNDHVGSKFLWTGQMNPTDPSLASEIESQMKEILSKLGLSLGSSTIEVEKTYIAWPVFYQGDNTRFYLYHDNSSSPPSWRMGADFCDAPNTLYFNEDKGGVVTTGCVDVISDKGVVNNKPKIEGGQTTVDDPSKYTANNILSGCGPGTDSNIYSAEQCRFGGQQLEVPMTTMKTITDANKPSGCFVENNQLFFNSSGVTNYEAGEKPGFINGKNNPLPSTDKKQYGLCYSPDGEKPKDVEGFSNQYPPYNFSQNSKFQKALVNIPRGPEFMGRDIYCPTCITSRTSGCGLGNDSCASRYLPNAANGTTYGVSNPKSSKNDMGWNVDQKGNVSNYKIGKTGNPVFGKKNVSHSKTTYTTNTNYNALSRPWGGGWTTASVNGGSLLGGSNRCPYIYSSLGAAENACNNNSRCKYIQKQGNLCGGNYELRGGGNVGIDDPYGAWSSFRLYEKDVNVTANTRTWTTQELATEYLDPNGFSISPDGSISSSGWKFCPEGSVNVNPKDDPNKWWDRCLPLEQPNALGVRDTAKAASPPKGGVFETFDNNKIAPWARKPLQAPGCIPIIKEFDKPGYFVNDLVKIQDFSPDEIDKYNIFEYELEYYDSNRVLKKEKVAVSTLPNCLDGVHNLPRYKPQWNDFRAMLVKTSSPMITEAKYNSPAFNWKLPYSQMQNLIDSGLSGKANCGDKTTPEKMIQTFNASGCPNTDSVSTSWWATQSKATVLADMNAYCTVVNNGTADGRQKSMCCGKDDVNCGKGKLKCKKQSDWAGCDSIGRAKPRGSCKNDYMNYFKSKKEWYRALVDLPKLQGGFFVSATVDGTANVPVAFVYTKKMKERGPTYNNFVEYGSFRPYYKVCDPNNASINISTGNFKDAKKKVINNLPPDKRQPYLADMTIKETFEGMTTGWEKTPEANILQTATKPGQAAVVTYTVKSKILYEKPDDVPVGSYNAKEGGSLSVLLPNTCWYVKKGVTSSKKNPNPYVIADAPFMGGCSNTTLFASTGSGVTLTRNGYLCSADGSQEYVCDTVKGALISYIATEINNSGLDPRCKILSEMKIDVKSIKITGFTTQTDIMNSIPDDDKAWARRLAGLSFNYPNAVPDSETGSVTINSNVLANIVQSRLPYNGDNWDYIWNWSTAKIAYKQCGGSGKTVTESFVLNDGDELELECDLYKMCDMRLYITDTGQLKLYKRPSQGWQSSGDNEGGGSADVIWATDPIQEIQDAPSIPKWREKRNYIETGENNFLGIGDYITSNNGKFRFYIKQVNSDPKSLWQQLLVSYGLIGKLKGLSVSGCRGYTTNVSSDTKCIGVIQYSVSACGDKAGGIMTYDFKSNKYEIKPSNSTLGSKYSNVAGYVSAYVNSYANNDGLYDTFYVDEFNKTYYISPDTVDFSKGRYVYIGRYGVAEKPFNILTIPTSEIQSKEKIEKWINQTIRNKGMTEKVQAYTIDLLKRTVKLYNKGFAPSKKNSDLVKLYPPQVLKDSSSLLYIRVSPVKDSAPNCTTMVVPGTITDITQQIGGSGGSGQPAKCTFARNTDSMRQKMFDDIKKLRNTAGRDMQNNINNLQSTQDLLIKKIIEQKNRFGEDSEDYHHYLKIMEDIEKDHVSAAMRTDSDLKLVHQNYRYIVWGILAISIMLGILAFRRK